MTEITISILGFVLSVTVNIVAIAFFFGRLSERVNGIKEDIVELKEEQKKSNEIKERLTITEESIKAAWKRIDELRGM
jgi:hypothetical protein